MVRPLSILALIGALGLMSPAYAGDIAVMSGGIGGEERAMIDSEKANYSLKIELIGKGGMYLSDVAISVRDASGAEVVSHTAEGPFVLINLPAGTYHLGFLATDGATEKQDVTIGEGQHRVLHVRFPNTES